MHRLAWLLALLAGPALADRPTTFAWDANPTWPAGTTVELCGNRDTCATGLTGTQHTLMLPIVPGDVIQGKARAHAPTSWTCTPQPTCMTSDWATVEATWPAPPQNMSATLIRRIEPQWLGFGTLDRRGSEATTNLSSTVNAVKAGDILLAVIQRQYQANCTSVSAGALVFTKLATASSGQSGLNVELWGAIATADAATLTVTALYSNSSTFGAMFVARYAGSLVGITPLAKTAHTSLRATTLNRTAPNLTVTKRAWLVAFGTDWGVAQGKTATTGWTVRADGNTFGSGSNLQFLLERIVEPGTYPSGNFATVTTSDRYIAGLVAFELP